MKYDKYYSSSKNCFIAWAMTTLLSFFILVAGSLNNWKISSIVLLTFVGFVSIHARPLYRQIRDIFGLN
mgnify:CR=1 FL=1